MSVPAGKDVVGCWMCQCVNVSSSDALVSEARAVVYCCSEPLTGDSIGSAVLGIRAPARGPFQATSGDSRRLNS